VLVEEVVEVALGQNWIFFLKEAEEAVVGQM
jgi:hypothetical protein